MRWEPQPKDRCAREDCNNVAAQAKYCMNHYHLFRRNGTPYRQDEISEQAARNKHEQEMDELLRSNPPEIVWRKDKHGVMRAVSVRDPHAEKSGDAKVDRRRYAAQVALEEETRVMAQAARDVAARFERHRVENTSLMQAARTQI